MPPVVVDDPVEVDEGLRAARLAPRADRSRPLAAGCRPSHWRASVSPLEWYIISRESSGNPAARGSVATSTGVAFGLGQVTSLNRQRIARRLRVSPNTVNPCVQLRIMRAYIRERYGSIGRAVHWWSRHHWY